MGWIKRIIIAGAGLLLSGMALAANFPNTVSSDSNLYIAKNNCGTLLTAAATSGATTITVADSSCFPTVGYITIDEEAMLCTGKTPTTFTGCTRGADGTSAVSHTNASEVSHYVIAAHHNVLKDELIAISTYFVQGADVHIDTTTAPDSVYLGTTTGNAHLTVWGTGGTNVISASTNTTGSPAALVLSNAGVTTATSLVVTGAATVGSTLGVTGAATAATLDTGQGTNELYDMNQNVQTSDAVIFAGVTDSALTSGRFVIAGASGVLTDDADFTQNGTTATFTGVAATSASITGQITTGLTASRVVVTDSGSHLTASAATATEASYLSGVTSAIQTQINAITASPAGAIVMYSSSTSPTGWLQCDGSTVSRTTYATLFAVVGTTWGVGDGSTSFGLPDFRGVYPKGAGTTTRAAGVDANGNAYAATLGAYTQDKSQGHWHDLFSNTGTGLTNRVNLSAGVSGIAPVEAGSGGSANVSEARAPKTDGTNGTPRVGLTTEPQHAGIYFIIKT